MAHDLDPDTTAQRARDLLDKRIQSVRDLVTKRQAVTDLRAQLDTAERDDTAAYTAALRDGWTADELKTLSTARTRRQTPHPQTQQDRHTTGHLTPVPSPQTSLTSPTGESSRASAAGSPGTFRTRTGPSGPALIPRGSFLPHRPHGLTHHPDIV